MAEIKKLDLSTLKVGDVVTLHSIFDRNFTSLNDKTLSFKVLSINGLLFGLSRRVYSNEFDKKSVIEFRLNTFDSFVTAYTLETELNAIYNEISVIYTYSHFTISQ